MEQIASSGPRTLSKQLGIANVPFALSMLQWDGEHTLSSFQLATHEGGPISSVISGAAYGLAADDVVAVLAQLVRIDDHPELIAAYESQIDERTRWLNRPQP